MGFNSEFKGLISLSGGICFETLAEGSSEQYTKIVKAGYGLPLYCYRPSAVDIADIYSGVCYNEQLLSITSGCYNEHKYYNERGGILSADAACACP